MNKDTLVICPVFDEGDYIQDFYWKLRNHYVADVIFIDDGSSDRSSEFLHKIRSQDTFLITHSQRYGYGQALLTGFKFALDYGYKRIVTIDVDLQHNPEHIHRFLRELYEYEVVLGSRYIRIDKYGEIPLSRLIINQYVSNLLEQLFATHFSDPFCGLRGYRDSFLKKADLRERSYGLSVEILLEIIRTHTSFKEASIEAIYFDTQRKFLDNLDNPRRRLLYYLEIIARKRRQIQRQYVHRLGENKLHT